MPSPYYSYLTQQIANNFASWMAIRTDPTSIGQQFLNVFGVEMQDVVRAFNAGQRGLFLSIADINTADVLQKVILPRAIPLDPNNPPTCIGDGNPITFESDINNFLYLNPPTRITQLSTATQSSLTFTDIMAYDIPFVDNFKTESQLNYQWDTNTSTLMKWHPVGQLLEVPGHIPQGIEVLGRYNLLNKSGNPISGVYKGACLYLDTMLILFDQTLYVFDVRIPIADPTTSGWVGNQEVTSIQAIAQFNVATTITGPSGISGLAYDPRTTMFWIKSGANYYQFQLNYDYVFFDFVRSIAFFRESYTSLTIAGTLYTQQIHDVWNYFDEFGLLLNTPRLLGETNQAYQLRLLSVFPYRSNSTVQGVVDGISRDMGLQYYGYFPSGQALYPKNLFPTGEFPSGNPIYASGLYPSGVYNVAQINALYDPVFYSGHMVGNTNVPDAEFVDYTKEVLSTFPIVWGSGNSDPIGFIWDLSPFDGGVNQTQIVPDFFAHLDSGVPADWYQSGVLNPDVQDLNVRIIADPATQDWIPQIWNGDFFINNNLYHLYANQGAEFIPSGVNPYNVIGSGALLPGFPITIVDIDGTTAPSGTHYINVSNFDNNSPYEFIYASGQILFENPQNGLYLYYETSPSGWYTIPGWDFNPTHSAVGDGFIWISKQQQVISPSGYTLTVNPNQLFIGGGASVLVGNLLDTTGEPVVGADAFFVEHPSGFGTITTFHSLTGLDGNAYSLYESPINISNFSLNSVATSGNTIEVSGLIASTNYSDIWTLQELPDTSGYPSPMPVMWMQFDETIDLAINPGEWLPLENGDANLGNFQGVYTIGSSASDNGSFGDELFNIDLTSLQINTGLGFNPIGRISGSGSAANIQYDIDNYSSPVDYGKVNLYTVIIPSGTTTVQFDTYEPVHPVSVQPNVPTSGFTTLTYPVIPVPSGSYTVYSPAAVTIESWADWQGVESIHQFQTITMDFPTSHTGVFRLDNKFIDFASYLRFT